MTRCIMSKGRMSVLRRICHGEKQWQTRMTRFIQALYNNTASVPTWDCNYTHWYFWWTSCSLFLLYKTIIHIYVKCYHCVFSECAENKMERFSGIVFGNLVHPIFIDILSITEIMVCYVIIRQISLSLLLYLSFTQMMVKKIASKVAVKTISATTIQRLDWI